MSERVIGNRVVRPVCVVNSLPKSGTHLLKKIISRLPGMVPEDFHLGPRPSLPDATLGNFDLDQFPHDQDVIPVGVGRPKLIPRDEIYRTVGVLTEGSFITAHVPFSSALALLLRELNIKLITIIRDPRDVVVSQAKFVVTRQVTPLSDHYRSLPEDECIMTAIVGIRKQPGLILRNIRERLESVLFWKTQSFNLITSFERLVGPQGGGSREVQLQEISVILSHLGLNCSASEIESIADNVFGGTDTFLRGVIGSWREYFTESHKQACKQLVGQLLIDLGYEQSLDW